MNFDIGGRRQIPLIRKNPEHEYAFECDGNGAMNITFDIVVNPIVTQVLVAPAYDDIDEILSADGLDDRLQSWYAEWDTGSSETVVSKDMAESLSLEVSNPEAIHSNDPDDLPKSKIHLLLHSGTIANVPVVIASAESMFGVDMQIGMDVIRHGDFAVSHWQNKTHMSFRIPSGAPISFAKNNA